MANGDGSLAFDFSAAQPAAARLEPVAAADDPPRPYTWSEEHRHACEVRFVAAMGYDRRVDYCRGVEERRGSTREQGRAAAKRLWRDARALIEQVNAGS